MISEEHRTKAIQCYMSIQLLTYGSMDKVNVDILSILASVICPIEEFHLDDRGVLMEGTIPDIVLDRLLDGFSIGDVSNVFAGLLLEHEKYEILQIFNLLRGV